MGIEPRIRVSAILRRENQILLCRHEKGEKEYWLLPGGGVNSGESLVDALHRELAEELGISDELPVEGPVAIVDSIAPVRSFAPKRAAAASRNTHQVHTRARPRPGGDTAPPPSTSTLTRKVAHVGDERAPTLHQGAHSAPR